MNLENLNDDIASTMTVVYYDGTVKKHFAADFKALAALLETTKQDWMDGKISHISAKDVEQ